MDLGNLASLRLFYPELLLTAGTLFIVLIDLALSDKSRLGDIALLTTRAALLLLGLEPHSNGARGCSSRMLVSTRSRFFSAP